MKNRLPNSEVPKILTWPKEPFRDEIDVANVWQVCEWCKNYAKYSPDKDTKNVLLRLNVGIYQLSYIGRMLYMNLVPACEWSEPVASCFIHVVGCFENIGLNCASRFDEVFGCPATFENWVYKACHLYSPPRDAYLSVLEDIPAVVQQVYYFEMGRSNRFNMKKLKIYGGRLLDNLIALNESGKSCLPFEQGIACAMGKLSDVELNGH